MKSNLIFIVLTLLVAACSPKTGKELSRPDLQKTEIPQQPPPSQEPPLFPPPDSGPEPETLAEESSLVASIEKHPCYGKCPVYELKVYDDGKVTFYGKAFAQKIGKYQAVASKSLIVDLMIKAEEINYFSLKDQYPLEESRIMYDFPVTTTYLKMEGREKIIQNRHDGPVDLTQFEKLFEALFLNLSWEKINR